MKYLDLIYFLSYWSQSRNKDKGAIVSFSLTAFVLTGIQAYLTLTLINIADIIYNKEIKFFLYFSYLEMVIALLVLNHIYIYVGNRKEKIIIRFSHLSDDVIKKYWRYLIIFIVISLLLFGISSHWRGHLLGLI